MHAATDPALEHLMQEPAMARIIAATPHPKPTVDWAGDLYLALLESIVSQQISVKAADAIFRRFRDLFPDRYPTAEAVRLKTTEELRSAGLSFQKITYIRSVAEFSLENRLDHSFINTLADEEIVQYLLPIKGVGRWTVEMLLMFVLDRPDVFPVDDLIIRQRMMRAFPEETADLTGRSLIRKLQDLAEPWRPYRTVASRYLWRWVP